MTHTRSSQDELNERFLCELFAFAEQGVFLTTLPNEKTGRGGSRHERMSPVSRETLLQNRQRVIEKYDRDGQAIYFCVSSLSPAKIEERRARVLSETGKEPQSDRNKECVAEIVVAHVDIDLKHLRLGETDVAHRLVGLEFPPTTVVYSGNGVHAYWLLTEALETDAETVADHEDLLRKIAFAVGGDSACAEVARLMRIPGSHNTKNGAFKPVNVIEAFTDFSRRYEHADLIQYFAELPRIIAPEEIVQVVDKRTGQSRPSYIAAADDNPFMAYVQAELAAGRISLPPIDVERMLAAMTPGDGEFGVHVVTRTVTASLVSRGWLPEEIVPFVMGGIAAMIDANGLPQGWTAGWQPAEERKLLGQIQGFIRKQDPEKLARARERKASERRPTAQRLAVVGGADVKKSEPTASLGEEVVVNGTTGAVDVESPSNVVQFKIERRGRGRPEKEVDPRGAVHVRLARMTLERLRLSGSEISFAKGELWIYRAEGIWRPYEGKDQNAWIETEVHATVNQVNQAAAKLAEDQMREAGETFDEDAKLRAEVRRYICTMPELHFHGRWDAHGLVPLANGLFDPQGETLEQYAPEHRATFRFAATYVAGATFVNGERMIRDLFEPYGAEAERYVWLVRQFAYVALFKVGRQIGRQLRRCLYLQGEQNSGKSQVLDLLRSAIGSEHCSATTLDEMSDPAQRRFALEGLMGKALWAADEAANERTRIDAARVKALLAEDIVKTDVKGKTAVEARFLSSAIFSSNSYPRTLDSASGFSDRFMLVRCPAVFNNEHPIGVARLAKEAGFSSPARFVAATELSGLLIWALGARDFIEKEQRFEQPAAVVAAREEIADKSNPVRAFIKECIEEAPLNQAAKSVDVYETYREWHAEDHGNKTFCVAPKSFWSAFNGYFNGRRGYAPRNIIRHHDGSLVLGVKLNEHGLDMWRSVSEKKNAGDKGIMSGISSSEYTITVDLEPDQLGKATQYFGFDLKSAAGGEGKSSGASEAAAPANNKAPRF